jgi:hypothetical protein
MTDRKNRHHHPIFLNSFFMISLAATLNIMSHEGEFDDVMRYAKREEQPSIYDKTGKTAI